LYDIDLPRKSVNEFLTVEDLGTYCLPSVQRDFVWDEDQIKELIDSLLRGYPIGVITVMETNIPIPSVPLIDVEDMVAPSDQTRKYVLDGQQRLTSLLLIRDGWKIKRDGKEISRKPIHFNPDDRTLRKKGKTEFGYDFSRLIRWTLHKEPTEQSVPRIQRTLAEVNKEFLARPLGFFTVRVSKDERNQDKVYSDMAEIFTRINRAGVRLGNLEIFLSFFASASPGKQEIVGLYEQLKSRYEIDLEPIIRLAFSNLGLTQNQVSRIESFKRNVSRITEKHTKDEILLSVSATGNALETIMEILGRELGVSSAETLPSQTCLVVLAKYLLERESTSPDQVKKGEIDNMLRWLILSSFYGLYSSSADTRLENDLKIVSGRGQLPIDGLLESMKHNNLRTEIQEKDFKNIDFNILRGNAGKRFLFVLYFLLHKNGATDWAGNPLAHSTQLVRHHILPKDNNTVKEMLDEDKRNHLGNLTFIDKGKNEEIGDELPEDYLSTMLPDALREHFIPTDKSLWKPEKYEEFINTRMDMMWHSLEVLMRSLSQQISSE